jgi:predicted dinucleotide-binding enzyme
MGGKLGTLFARAGHEVVFSYARSAQKLERLAREAQGKARAGTPAEAAREADALLLASRAASSRVVAAFGTVPSEVLFSVYDRRHKSNRPSLVYCGDDLEAKELTAGLIRDVGFDPVDAGPLKMARYAEPFSLLIAQLAYEGSGGPQLAYRFERLGD